MGSTDERTHYFSSTHQATVAEPFAVEDWDSGLLFAVPAGRTVHVTSTFLDGRALVTAYNGGNRLTGWVERATVNRAMCPNTTTSGYPSVRVAARLAAPLLG